MLSVYKNGSYVGEVYPRREYYYEAQQPITIAGVRSTFEDDLYVLLVDWQPFPPLLPRSRYYHNPLVKWLWLGAWLFILGTLVAAWPDKDPEKVVSAILVTVPSNARLDPDVKRSLLAILFTLLFGF